PAHLGAWRRPHQGLRLGRLRGGGRGRASWPGRPDRVGDSAGRRATHRMARAWPPRTDDRPGRVRVRGQIRSGAIRRECDPMSVDVVTFGCRLNAYEAQVIRRQAQTAGLADVVVVNTCAVTAEAVRQSCQAIRKLKREHPDAAIVVTG